MQKYPATQISDYTCFHISKHAQKKNKSIIFSTMLTIKPKTPLKIYIDKHTRVELSYERHWKWAVETFRNGIALVEGIEGGLKRAKSLELYNFAKPIEVGDGAPNNLDVLPDFVQPVSQKQRVPWRRLIEQVQRHWWVQSFSPPEGLNATACVRVFLCSGVGIVYRWRRRRKGTIKRGGAEVGF